jgi:uncharacterized protein YukJ
MRSGHHGDRPIPPSSRRPAPNASAPGAAGLRAYGVVRGRPLEQRVYPDVASPAASRDNPHLHVRIDGGARQYDAAINVYSKDGSEVLFRIAPDFAPPRVADLLALPAGATPIGPGRADGLGLDYLRQHLVARADMTALPVDPARPADDLKNALGALVSSAIAAGADVFVFGSLFSGPGGSPSGANPFGLDPDAGVHDVHMNQGNPGGPHGGENGAYQDGGLLVHFPGPAAGWTAVFLAFRTQSFALGA